MTLHDPVAEPARDLAELRRSLRDVVALTMLPTVWAAYEPRQICVDLVDVITRMIDVDGVYLIAGSADGGEILRLTREKDRETERCLRSAAVGEISGVKVIPSSRSGVSLRLVTFPLSVETNDRFAVASRRAKFPSETERLILRVAANQALTWLDLKRAEAAVVAESAFRRALEESMAAGVAVVDSVGRQSYVNRAFAEMVGWTEAELIGRTPPFPYWAPENLPEIHAALDEVISGVANPAGYELRFQRRNGERFDALVLTRSFDQPGRAPGFLASVYDITDRKAAERSARFLAEAGEILGRSLDYEETLRSISSLLVPRFADWCFIDLIDAAGGFRRIAVGHPPGARNEAIARRLARSYPPGKALHGLSHPFTEGSPYLDNDVSEDLLVAASPDREHLETLRSMNIRCFVSVPMTSRSTAFGVLTFVGTDIRMRFEPRDVALAEEVGRRVALALDNARLYRNAQEANRAKDEFLANLSHELRTPMTTILGWAHLLQLADLDKEQVAHGLRTIRQSGEAQARLIDDLLDVSRIVTGKLRLNMATVDLSEIARDAIAAIRPAAEAKRHLLDVDIRTDDAVVLGDPSRLQQVFWNLLSNAVKFTPPGGLVRFHLEGRGDDLVLTVSDSGEGIAPEFLPLVFERFRQAPAGASARSGLGLGLAIAKELVEMHGGSIAAESRGGGTGATFTVTLPRMTDAKSVRSPEQAHFEERGQQSLRSLRVLVVEQDTAARALMVTVLENFGAVVTAVASEAEAETALLDFEPEILIAGIHPARQDGLAVLPRLRKSRPALPVIGVGNYAGAGTRERVMAAGFNGFVARPLDPILLSEEIGRARAAV